MKSSLGLGKKMIWEAIELLFGSGVMPFSGHGNISARLGEDRMVLTSKGVLRSLKPDDFVTVSFDNKVLEGEIDPATSEIVTIHTAIYQVCKEAGSIIHSHSPYAKAFALAQQPLPCAYEALFRFGIRDAIPVAAWAPHGSKESVSNILKQIAEHPNSPAVLLANYGLLGFGANPIQAAELMIVIEETARAVLGARILGGEKSFPADALKRVQQRIAEFKTEK
jgi:L-ribulose-5-phosphate 4-epimerase